MTVSDLIEIPSHYNSDAQVILQKDAEGNAYSPLSGVEDAYYAPETTWSGDCFDLEVDAALHGPYHKCVLLWPVN